jgi:RimJ/RimL family protein N-acetyltransferase
MESAEEAWQYGNGLLVGQSVRLRELQETDLDQLVHWWNDPAYAPLQAPIVRPQPVTSVRETFQKWSANDSDSAVGFSVIDRESQALVGHIAISGIHARTRAGVLAIVVGGDQTERGYGTDAVRVMVRYGFEELGLNRIELHVFAYNSRAIATYRKVGFVEEGRRRQAAFHAGRFHDSVIMSLLAEEYRRE